MRCCVTTITSAASSVRADLVPLRRRAQANLTPRAPRIFFVHAETFDGAVGVATGPESATGKFQTKLSASGSRARGAHAGDVEVRPDQVFGRARDEEASLVDQENRRVRGEVRLKPLDAGRPDLRRSIVRIGNICA